MTPSSVLCSGRPAVSGGCAEAVLGTHYRMLQTRRAVGERLLCLPPMLRVFAGVRSVLRALSRRVSGLPCVGWEVLDKHRRDMLAGWQ